MEGQYGGGGVARPCVRWVCRSSMATGSYDVTVKTSLLGPLSLGENGVRSGVGWEEGRGMG